MGTAHDTEAGMGVMSRDSGRQRRYVYGCIANHKRGETVCANSIVVAMDTIDGEVLATLADRVLRPAVVDAVIAGVLEALQPATQAQAAEGYQLN